MQWDETDCALIFDSVHWPAIRGQHFAIWVIDAILAKSVLNDCGKFTDSDSCSGFAMTIDYAGNRIVRPARA